MTEETTPTFLEQVKAEREALEKVRDENKKLIEEMRELKATEILSGKAEKPEETKKPEISPKEYSEKVLRGEL